MLERGPGLVTSGQLRHPTLRVVDPHLPLVLLGEKQEIHLRAHTRWGRSRSTHSLPWRPCSTASCRTSR